MLVTYIRGINDRRVWRHQIGTWTLWHCSRDATRPNCHALQWRHNELDCVSNHQPHDCLLNCLFMRRSKKTWKLRVTGLCVGNSPVTSPHKRPVKRKMFPLDDVIMMVSSRKAVTYRVGISVKYEKMTMRMIYEDDMGQVPELWLSFSLVLLSIDSKTR